MEFHSLGKHCARLDCSQNDFLPFTCSFCEAVFCKDHFQPQLHGCTKHVDNSVENIQNTAPSYFECRQEGCKERSAVLMECSECKEHYCVAHRYHGCLELTGEKKVKELKKWQKPVAQFEVAKRAADLEIKEALKKSKNIALANKVQLMRLKGKANGLKTIPTANRRYFLAYGPKENARQVPPKPTFVSHDWTIGKVTDMISKSFNVFKVEDNTKRPKLFHHSTGQLVTQQMDVTLQNLLDNNVLTEGQSLILEFSNDSQIDPTSYVCFDTQDCKSGTLWE